jgi:hypothetical protein
VGYRPPEPVACPLRARHTGDQGGLTGIGGQPYHPAELGRGRSTRSRAEIFQTGYAGSIPVARSHHKGPGHPPCGNLGLRSSAGLLLPSCPLRARSLHRALPSRLEGFAECLRDDPCLGQGSRAGRSTPPVKSTSSMARYAPTVLADHLLQVLKRVPHARRRLADEPREASLPSLVTHCGYPLLCVFIDRLLSLSRGFSPQVRRHAVCAGHRVEHASGANMDPYGSTGDLILIHRDGPTG